MSVLSIEAEVSINSGVQAECTIGREVIIEVHDEANLESLEVTANGHYEPEAGVDGFSSVDADIQFDGYLLDDIASGNEPSGDIVINSKNIRISCFWDCVGLTSVIFEGTESIGNNAFYSCTNLTSIYGKNVITINSQAFMNCFKLTDIKMPKLQTIGATAFRTLYNLISISLPSAINIGANAFFGCSKLKDIYLPNDASTYTNAPWGATNATIHYNTVFDENGEPIL